MVEKYFSEIPVAITVTDLNGDIVYMNNKSEKVFENYGGKELIGKNIFNYHNSNSQNQITEMLKNNTTNVYTIEKNGIKKIIFQSPWTVNNTVKGMVELSYEIPFEMKHFKRT